jgi:quercetin dioxygenase-like cupin family protein
MNNLVNPSRQKKFDDYMKNLKKLKNRDDQNITEEHLVVHSKDAIWLDSKTTGNPTEIGLLLDIPTKSMEFYLQKIPKGGSSDLQRHVHESIHYVLNGSGRTEIGNQIVEWSKGDFIYTPPWIWHRHYNDGVTEVEMLLVENSRLMDGMEGNRRDSLGLKSFKEAFKEYFE